jgi:histidine ammonia-lyase
VHLRGAAKRVGVLHLVAPAVRLDDRGAFEQQPDVGRRLPLPLERARGVDRLEEARARSLQRFERLRTGEVGRRGESPRADEPERRHRSHELRAVDQRQPLLRGELHRLETDTRECVPAREALARVGLEPTRLEAKEGLSLINGTQFMAAFLALGLVRARRLTQAADLACALSLEALQGSRTSFLPQIHALRPLRGQIDSAANVLLLLEGSAINESHRWCDKVQDAYSLRCAPQVHGASRDLLDYCEYTIAVELNAATDNPLVLVDDEALVSNGNFHGQPLAFALDALAMAVSELASISERRVERLVNPNLSDGLPAFLTTDGGLNSGFMIPQYVAASLVSENKVLSHPASVDSIPTSAGQEDHVSMGNTAGLKAWQVLANCERALAIELLAGAQGVEFHAPLEPGTGVQATRGAVRELSPRLRDDRSLAPDIEEVALAIRGRTLVEAAEAKVGALR